MQLDLEDQRGGSIGTYIAGPIPKAGESVGLEKSHSYSRAFCYN